MAICNEQIEQAVIVIIEKASTKAQNIERRGEYACLAGGLAHVTVLVVMPDVIAVSLEV